VDALGDYGVEHLEMPVTPDVGLQGGPREQSGACGRLLVLGPHRAHQLDCALACLCPRREQLDRARIVRRRQERAGHQIDAVARALLHVNTGGNTQAQRALRALANAQIDLAAGFTAVLDMDSRGSFYTVDLRDAINSGIVQGPRMQVVGQSINQRARRRDIQL
jgi:hypothetical protein